MRAVSAGPSEDCEGHAAGRGVAAQGSAFRATTHRPVRARCRPARRTRARCAARSTSRRASRNPRPARVLRASRGTRGRRRARARLTRAATPHPAAGPLALERCYAGAGNPAGLRLARSADGMALFLDGPSGPSNSKTAPRAAASYRLGMGRADAGNGQGRSSRAAPSGGTRQRGKRARTLALAYPLFPRYFAMSKSTKSAWWKMIDSIERCTLSPSCECVATMCITSGGRSCL